MEINISLSGSPVSLTVQANETLMRALRRNALYSVKHGCETGECGSCTVLIDGRLMPTCIILAAQVDGRSVTTLESLAKTQREMHPLQEAFVETGAIQC